MLGRCGLKTTAPKLYHKIRYLSIGIYPSWQIPDAMLVRPGFYVPRFFEFVKKNKFLDW